MKKTPMEEWLEEYSKDSTRIGNERDFKEFCEWAHTTDVELVQEYKSAEDKEAWAKKTGALLVKWYNWMLKDYPCKERGGRVFKKGLATNTARARVSSARAFFRNQCRPVIVRRGAIARAKPALGEHEFTQEELRKMFFFADTRGKAVLSTAISLGWGAKDFVDLRRSFIEPFLEKEAFTGFLYERGKTGAISRSHLTPEAIECLKTWFEIADESEYVWPNSGGKKHITQDTLNNIVKDAVEKAGIKTTGNVHFHLLRKFLISQLSNEGLNIWHIKFMVGKQVPPDIATYLQGMKDTLSEEFKRAHPRFSLMFEFNKTKDEMERLKEENQRLKDTLRGFADMLGLSEKREQGIELLKKSGVELSVEDAQRMDILEILRIRGERERLKEGK